MINFQRIFYKDNTDLVDLSVNMNDFLNDSYTFNVEASNDAIFIGSILPWSNRYFSVKTANTDTSSLIIETWDGNSFTPSFDLIDETISSEITMSEAGLVRFTPDKDISWVREYESFQIPELSSTYVLRMFWTKITFTQDCSFTLDYIGQKFCDDNDLYAQYPDLDKPELRERYKSGKTDWSEQAFIASNYIIKDLSKRSLAISEHQVLSPELFEDPCIHKTAEIIYAAFGEGYRDDRNLARKAYEDMMDIKMHHIDKNQDGRLQLAEATMSTGYLRR